MRQVWVVSMADSSESRLCGPRPATSSHTPRWRQYGHKGTSVRVFPHLAMAEYADHRQISGAAKAGAWVTVLGHEPTFREEQADDAFPSPARTATDDDSRAGGNRPKHGSQTERAYVRMKNFSLIARCPGVTGAVVGDSTGAVIEFSGNIDAENTSAVMAFISQSLTQCGEQLGLGGLVQAVVSSPAQNCLVTVVDNEVLGVCLDATKPMAPFEKKLSEILQR